MENKNSINYLFRQLVPKGHESTFNHLLIEVQQMYKEELIAFASKCIVELQSKNNCKSVNEIFKEEFGSKN